MRSLPSNAEKTYSVVECSRILGITPAVIRCWIRRGELPAHKIKKHWCVKQTDLRIYQADRPPEKI